MSEQDKPECVTEKHLEHLDWLRESGVTNMWGAVPYLMAEFAGLCKSDAKKILVFWMQTFKSGRSVCC